MKSTRTNPHVAIIGAGPSGCLLALLLAEQNARVSIYDMRNDPRHETEDGSGVNKVRSRSINLSLSKRGLSALERVGLCDLLKEESVPTYSRCVHKVNARGEAMTELHPYGQPGEHLLSITRTQMTSSLIEACDKHPRIELFFLYKCTEVDLHRPSVTVIDAKGSQSIVTPSLVVGADGAHSRVRAAMTRQKGFNFSQTYFTAAYKELSLFADTDSRNATFVKEAVHIWPRGGTMLLALPNKSKTEDQLTNFTATLFMPRKEFDVLQTQEQVHAFFQKMFPDAMEAMPNLTEEFFLNPTESLCTVRCSPFNFGANAVLVGDAAHTIVPFYAQGCNASFEDAVLLGDSVRRYGWDNIHTALHQYATTRKPNADAIADLAIRQYNDMSTRSAVRFFVLKRRLEIILNWLFPHSFYPLYSMVAFSNIPYAQAVARAKKQDRFLAYAIMALLLAFILSPFVVFTPIADCFSSLTQSFISRMVGTSWC